MKLKSIYEHMEKATKNIPENANVKIMQDENDTHEKTRDSFWKLLDSLYPENENINNEDDEMWNYYISNFSSSSSSIFYIDDSFWLDTIVDG